MVGVVHMIVGVGGVVSFGFITLMLSYTYRVALHVIYIIM